MHNNSIPMETVLNRAAKILKEIKEGENRKNELLELTYNSSKGNLERWSFSIFNFLLKLPDNLGIGNFNTTEGVVIIKRSGVGIETVNNGKPIYYSGKIFSDLLDRGGIQEHRILGLESRNIKRITRALINVVSVLYEDGILTNTLETESLTKLYFMNIMGYKRERYSSFDPRGGDGTDHLEFDDKKIRRIIVRSARPQGIYAGYREFY